METHSHNHTHGHDHGSHGHSHDARALLIAMVCTGVIFLVQVVGGWLSNSLALLSDAGHMLTDFSALLISFIALRLAHRPKGSYPTRFTYGLQRIEILAALVNGVILVAICLYIAVESVQRFIHPEHVLTVPMLIVATVGLLANAVSAYVLHGTEGLNTRSAYLHVITDLLSSVGVIVGGIVMYYTHIEWIDPLLSLLIAVFIVQSAYKIIRESGIVLMESAPVTIDIPSVHHALESLPDIQNIHDMHVWQVGTGEVAISAHIVLRTLVHQEQVLQQVRAKLKDEFSITHSTIQIESQRFSESEDCHSCCL